MYFVFGRRRIDACRLAQSLLASSLRKAVVFLDLSYQHIASALAQQLEAEQGRIRKRKCCGVYVYAWMCVEYPPHTIALDV